MPLLTLPLESAGPIIGVALFVSAPRRAALEKAGQPIPPPVLARGLIDTGASCTCVDPTVIKSLQLVPSGAVMIHTPSTGTSPHTCNQFDIGIAVIMDNGLHVSLPNMAIPVIESHLANQGIQALLGRDLLDQGILIYHGASRSVTLAF